VSDSSPMTMYAIPPYMLEQIRQHGPDELRAAAAEALARSDSLRSERIAVQSRLASGELSRPDAAVSDPAVAGRRVFDAGGSEVLPGTLARSDADPPTGDAAVDEAFAGAGLTYFFYRDEYQGVAFHDDRGGVHLNSGIPSRAFYVAAMELGGYAWQRAGRIWYRALCNYLGRDADFRGAALLLIQVARDEFGEGSLEEKAVEKGWRDVKVL